MLRGESPEYMKNGTYKIPDARSTSPTSEQLEAYESGPQKISDEIKKLVFWRRIIQLDAF